jgi:hypothetical protein
MFGITATPVFRHSDKAKCFGFADGRCDEARRDTVVHEIELCDWQAAVIVPTVVSKLDLDARNHSVRGEAKGAVSRRFQHFNQAW